MITLKLKIKTLSDKELVEKKQQEYSYAFRKLYSGLQKELSEDQQKHLFANIQEEYNLDSWEFISLKKQVETKIKQGKTLRENAQMEIALINKELESNDLTPKQRYKKYNRICHLNNILNSDIVFGGKKLLSDYNKMCNLKGKTSPEAIELKKQYVKNRILPIYIVGEAPHHCNRKMTFYLINNKVTYKPSKGKHCEIEFLCSQNYKNKLVELQNLAEESLLPITFSLSTEYLCLSYDESPLSNKLIKKTL